MKAPIKDEICNAVLDRMRERAACHPICSMDSTGEGVANIISAQGGLA